MDKPILASAESTASNARSPGVRIVLVTSIRLYREGLAAQLGAYPDFSIVGTAEDGDGAQRVVASARPDVLLLDIRSPGVFDLVRGTKAVHPDLRIVAYAVDECERDIDACAQAGVAAFVTRDVTVDGLAAAIGSAVRGELSCSPRAAALLFRRVAALSAGGGGAAATPGAVATLTAREREIVSLIAEGCSNKQIGRSLNIAVATVKNHTHHILEKLHVSTRAEVASQLPPSWRGN